MVNSGLKLTVTYYGEITIEPILNPEFDVDSDSDLRNRCFESDLSRFGAFSRHVLAGCLQGHVAFG